MSCRHIAHPAPSVRSISYIHTIRRQCTTSCPNKKHKRYSGNKLTLLLSIILNRMTEETIFVTKFWYYEIHFFLSLIQLPLWYKQDVYRKIQFQIQHMLAYLRMQRGILFRSCCHRFVFMFVSLSCIFAVVTVYWLGYYSILFKASLKRPVSPKTSKRICSSRNESWIIAKSVRIWNT